MSEPTVEVPGEEVVVVDPDLDDPELEVTTQHVEKDVHDDNG